MRRFSRLAMHLLSLALSTSTAIAQTRCEVQGEVAHWMYDACMFDSGTDDGLAPEVEACIARAERALHRFKPCTKKRILKERVCRKAVGQVSKDVRYCMQDPGMKGPTVRNGGL
ncbi:hypothetical protein NYO99_03315 [Pelomonas sp. UHG3]|uniref:Uncharacterized protein n=2 Tax=Roseateles hydrophilus TaxID=2975054 RepID=A0ACC6C6H0_9BURK|nr:hypothetical protein [Pelomonas sp. UHG3]